MKTSENFMKNEGVYIPENDIDLQERVIATFTEGINELRQKQSQKNPADDPNDDMATKH